MCARLLFVILFSNLSLQRFAEAFMNFRTSRSTECASHKLDQKINACVANRHLLYSESFASITCGTPTLLLYAPNRSMLRQLAPRRHQV